jgi:phosphate transport system substrate-binding protein
MEAGCRTFEWLEALADADPERQRLVCHTVREDGAFVEAGENDNLIVQKLVANRGTIGIFGYSYLDQNLDRLKSLPIDGILPTYDTIADASYPISRPLYFYVKKAHVDVIPGLRAFIDELTSDRAWGDDGYLADRGLIVLPHAEREQIAEDVRTLTPTSFAAIL